MVSLKLILKFFNREFIIKVLFLFLLYSLVPLAEIYILLYLGGHIGNYFTLALAASTGLFGMLIVLREFQANLKLLRRKIKYGDYPRLEFMSLAGVIIGGILLLTPGFVTDFIGFLLFMPLFRNWVGKIVTKRMESNLKEIYEYLTLYDL